MLDTVVSLLEIVDLTPADGVVSAIGTVVLFVFYRVLSASVFGPVLEHIEKREQLTSGYLKTASEMKQKSAALKEHYEGSLFEARVEAQSARSVVVEDAKQKAAGILKTAEEEVAADVRAGRDSIEEQIAKAEGVSEQEVASLAETLATSVDGRLSA